MAKVKQSAGPQKKSYDIIVIGSGPAGQKASLQAAKAGYSAVVVEEHPCVGGWCTHVGTLPSKSFRESVYRYSMSSRGQKTKAPLPDMKRLLERCKRVVKEESAIVHNQLERNRVEILTGRGRILSVNEVEIQQKRATYKISGKFIFIATGARPQAPSHIHVDGKDILDSSSILNLKKVPKSLAVLGAGIIGCEYATMFSTAGTHVHLVDRRKDILNTVDHEVVEHLIERFEHHGMETHFNTDGERIEKTRGGVTVHLNNGKKIKVEKVLASQGRTGNTENMGLENVGIEPNDRGLIAVDSNFRTNVPNIYAVGDVIGAPALASTSMEQGRMACRHAFGLPDDSLIEYFPYGIYTIPEISTVGLTTEELTAKKIDFVAGKAKYKELARGQIVGDQWGLLKLLVDRKTLKLLGVHIVGDGAADLVHIGQAVMALGGDVNYFIRTVFNYPTMAEAYKTAAFHAMNQIKPLTTPQAPSTQPRK